jgi:neopullulanase
MKRRWFVVLTLLICLSLWRPPSLRAITPASESASPTLTTALAQTAPQISKVDPPNWWLKHTINPVQLVMRGTNLQNATLTTNQPGFKVRRSSANGNYLIAYLEIDPQTAVAGKVPLVIKTDQGETTVDFPVQELPSPVGKYQGFNPDDVLYLIMVDRFSDGDAGNNDPAISAGFFDRKKTRAYHGGDLQGVIDRLPYLRDLGVTTLWLTPIYDNSNRASDYHGYGAVDYYQVEEHFGDLAKYQELVTRAHTMGIKIVQDQVPNHIGPDHLWTDDPPTRQFLNGTRRQHLNNPFDIPSITDPQGDKARVEATLRGWFADILPDINQDDPEATQYLIQNSLWWIAQTGLDGIRLDTFPYVPRSFWAKWTAAVRQQHPQLTVVGEVFDPRPGVVGFFQGGVARFDGIDSGLDMPFDFPTFFAIRNFFTRGSGALSDILLADTSYTRPQVLVPFLGNHDVKRFASEMGATLEKQILANTYLLTMRGIPQLYYGDEIAMTGEEDPDNRKDFPGGFPGDSRSAFTNEGRTRSEQQIFDAVQRLLQIRKNQPALRGGDMTVLQDRDGVLAYLRSRDGMRVVVGINNTETAKTVTVTLPEGALAEGSRFTDLLGQAKMSVLKRGKLKLRLAPRKAVIYQAN